MTEAAKARMRVAVVLFVICVFGWLGASIYQDQKTAGIRQQAEQYRLSNTVRDGTFGR